MTTRKLSRNQRFRALFESGEPFVCMGACDAITAKLARAAGAAAIFVSGFEPELAGRHRQGWNQT